MNDTVESALPNVTADGETQMKFAVHAQYTKDLSFENPRAPQILFQAKEQPQGEIRVEIDLRDLGNDRFEVNLQFGIQAKSDNEVTFLVELSYCGVFTVAGLSDGQREMVLYVECPRILFPFARRVIADTVRDGGLPPLMIGPIDFLALYRQRRTSETAKAGGNGKDSSAVAEEESHDDEGVAPAQEAEPDDGNGADNSEKDKPAKKKTAGRKRRQMQ